MNDLVLVKLGGSLITDKRRPETPRPDVIRRLARELRESLGEISERLVLGHGSGSFGHVAAQRWELAGAASGGLLTPAQLPGIAATQSQAAKLHRLVADELLDAGLMPFSVAPSSAMMAENGLPRRVFLESLVGALDRGLLPVVYGDVVLDRMRGAAIVSTETVFHCLAQRLRTRGYRVTRAIWLGETDGVYDEAGQVLPEIATDGGRQGLEAVGGAAGTDVTGGMQHRLETALALARLGVESWVANGLTRGLLAQAVAGQPGLGTRIGPPAGPTPEAPPVPEADGTETTT